MTSDTVSAWFRKNIGLGRACLGKLLALQLITLPVLLVLSTISNYESFRDSADNDNPLKFNGVDWLILGLGQLELILLVAITLASIRMVAARAVGQSLSIGEAIKGARPRMLAGVAWVYLYILLTVVGSVLCLFPGIYVALVAVFVLPVVAVERSNALRRCFALFHQDLGNALGRAVTIALVLFGPLMVANLGFLLVENLAGLPNATGSLVLIAALEALVMTAVAVIGGLFASPLALGMYADLRVLGEPTSAQHIAQELGITPPPSPQP